ncbi:hypothetical protein AAFF_G00302880 [Aldrovandia affinis]|uniref:Cyclin T2 n=1 Tax=Aldrovandia affinis TaxID=143900 RepID=A0AAD7RAT9_9TELE|nr:hypothetical protein AAFF_G00302880 [Aldrovandia affinis]
MAAYRASSSRWFFTRDQLETTPSRRCGVEPDKELSYRQQAANLIQDMGQRLNVLHLTTFCLQHKPTVIACVCIHLACKWSNWEIPVSTDGKHWWEYVDPSVTLELLDELTHEFLQILEKTPSRLKRIRNWRATQAAKKPKGDGQSADSAYPGPSLIHEHSMVDSIPGVSGNATFPKTLSFPIGLPSNSGGVLSLDSITSMQGVPYTFTAPSDWPQDAPNIHCMDKSSDFPRANRTTRGERWDKANSLKMCIPIPPTNKGGSSKEELKMKIKVSSERHSSLDEGRAKRKHSSPLVVSKEKHKEHSTHRHHKHGQTHPHQHSGNGRGAPWVSL